MDLSGFLGSGSDLKSLIAYSAHLIYNSEVLRTKLINKGHKFANKSDSEVLLHGYEEYGRCNESYRWFICECNWEYSMCNEF